MPAISDHRNIANIVSCYANLIKAIKELGWSIEKNIEDIRQDTWRWQKINSHSHHS